MITIKFRTGEAGGDDTDTRYDNSPRVWLDDFLAMRPLPSISRPSVAPDCRPDKAPGIYRERALLLGVRENFAAAASAPGCVRPPN